MPIIYENYSSKMIFFLTCSSLSKLTWLWMVDCLKKSCEISNEDNICQHNWPWIQKLWHWVELIEKDLNGVKSLWILLIALLPKTMSSIKRIRYQTILQNHAHITWPWSDHLPYNFYNCYQCNCATINLTNSPNHLTTPNTKQKMCIISHSAMNDPIWGNMWW